jgi:lipid-A-disaccharide synthase
VLRNPDAPTILLSAGDPSGDQHGAAVAAALLDRWPHASLFGLGGPRMSAAGVELLADFDDIAVMGFVEVVGKVPFFLKLLRLVTAEIQARNTHLVLPIDYPGFNLRLARQAHSGGTPVLYYIAPQVWAWHRSRTRQLASYTNRLAVVLPFEEDIFRAAGAHATFVGHPLLDRPPLHTDRVKFCAALGLDPGRPILALFPGSRAQDVQQHLQLFVETAARVRAQHPYVQPVIASAHTVHASTYGDLSLARSADPRELLTHARAALVKSGTSTLEAALTGTPMVIAYRMHPLSYMLARALVRVDHIGLVNLVAGERLMPELIQHDANPAALATALSPFLLETAERDRAVAGLERVRNALAAPGQHERTAAQRVSDLAAELIGSGAL